MKKDNSYVGRLNEIIFPRVHSEQKAIIIINIASKQTKEKKKSEKAYNIWTSNEKSKEIKA